MNEKRQCGFVGTAERTSRTVDIHEDFKNERLKAGFNKYSFPVSKEDAVM